jgi:hypothetical protein
MMNFEEALPEGAGSLVLRGRRGFLESLLLAPHLFGQLLGDGHELSGHEVLAVQLNLACQAHGQEGLEDCLGRKPLADQVDGDLLPLVGQLIADFGNIVAHSRTIQDPARVVAFRTHTLGDCHAAYIERF